MLFETRLTEARDPIVKKGTLIKVGCNGERFWCIVSQIEGDGRVGAIVDNELLRLPWHCGDPLHLKLENVLETSEKEDGAHFAALIDAYESVSDAAMAWYAERVEDGRAVKATPSVVLVLPA